MSQIAYIVLGILEIPFVLIGWLDYFWNSIWKAFSNISIIFTLPALATTPITWVNMLVLATLTFWKRRVVGEQLTYNQALNDSLDRFPEL